MAAHVQYLRHVIVTVVDGRFHEASGVEVSLYGTAQIITVFMRCLFPVQQSDVHNPIAPACLYPRHTSSLSSSVSLSECGGVII